MFKLTLYVGSDCPRICSCLRSNDLISLRTFQNYGSERTLPYMPSVVASHHRPKSCELVARLSHYSQSTPLATLGSSSVLRSCKNLTNKLHTTSRPHTVHDESKKSTAPHDTVLHRMQRLEDSLRYHGYSTIRIGLALVIFIGLAIYIFREAIREHAAEEVSQVATRSLEDRLVADKAEEFAKGLLNALLKDEPMHQVASQFVVEVLQRSETKQAMSTLVMDVLHDPNTKAQLTATVQQVIVTALNDKDTQDYIRSMLSVILSDKETRGAITNLLGHVFRDTAVKEQTAVFFRDVLRSESVVDQATQLGKQVTQSVISDPVLQEKTGDSLWSAMVFSVTPRWFGGSSSSSSTSDSGDAKQAEDLKTGTAEPDTDKESVLGG
ncbi:uncharacterized protein LOC119740977 isoform X2 [Patiria miniata]|uniref:Uncharacterized protein n=1 Tax=Patiria miniata TaxID=46514 RepID=A0A914B8E1_PATMI|nr:uncharacterized protein LOC119740977 isoform X2 [Patiria miniata]